MSLLLLVPIYAINKWWWWWWWWYTEKEVKCHSFLFTFLQAHCGKSAV